MTWHGTACESERELPGCTRGAPTDMHFCWLVAHQTIAPQALVACNTAAYSPQVLTEASHTFTNDKLHHGFLYRHFNADALPYFVSVYQIRIIVCDLIVQGVNSPQLPQGTHHLSPDHKQRPGGLDRRGGLQTWHGELHGSIREEGQQRVQQLRQQHCGPSACHQLRQQALHQR
jgi:hypothetical protein